MKSIKLLLALQLFVASIVLAQSSSKPNQNISFPSASRGYAQAKITSKLFTSEGNTWGYDIFVEGTRFIHQPTKPGLPGNSGFTTRNKAQRVAKLVIQKIKKGEMPPSITIEEMKKLKAL